MILYHGSQIIVQKPELEKGVPFNDYGRGFYCTENIELAKEWACGNNTDGFANIYNIDTQNLSILNLNCGKYNILNWLAILMENRQVVMRFPIQIEGRKYLLNNFLPDYKDYDIMIGYRADDCYFSFVRAFMSNTISLSQLFSAMKLGNLGEQVVLKSKKAFEQIVFKDTELADVNIYYPKKKTRDEKAKNGFLDISNNPDLSGIFMRDIIMEDIKDDDPRLF